METKHCPICGREMIAKPLFTSVYHECPRCDSKQKDPESDPDPYHVPSFDPDYFPDYNSKFVSQNSGYGPKLVVAKGMREILGKFTDVEFIVEDDYILIDGVRVGGVDYSFNIPPVDVKTHEFGCSPNLIPKRPFLTGAEFREANLRKSADNNDLINRMHAEIIKALKKKPHG